MAEMTPMMKQYFDIKEQHKDCILMFRLGDFYEMFFDDAKLASQELELVLTGRDCGQEERAPMCGVPFHSCEGYIARLIARGYKVAICEQVEDPSTANGLVKREVIRVITPGTVIEGSMLDEGRNNYLGVLFVSDGASDAGVCFTDCSTGEIHLIHITGEDVAIRVTNELGRFSPSEILYNDAAEAEQTISDFISKRLDISPQLPPAESFEYKNCVERILKHFNKSSLSELELEDRYPAVRALGGTLNYLYSTQMSGLERITNLDIYSDVRFMKLDLTARRNLELLETMRGKEKRGSLLGVLDHTKTAMGKRLIRGWLEQPLVNAAQISRRHNAVDELVHDSILRGDLSELLRDIYDLERIMTRVVYGSANARELRSLYQTICRLAPIKERLAQVKSALLCDIRDEIDPLHDVQSLIENSIVDDPPFSVREGGMIREGYNQEVDELRFEMSDGKGVIARVEAKEKERTGIKNLKVGYNRVFGYYIEISRSFTGKVPDEYIRKQTLANAERYITQELKELETRVLGAKDRVIALEYQLFNEVRLKVADELQRIQKTAGAVARLDVLCSFADTAQRYNYTRPIVDLRGEIIIKNGRHPVVEAIMDAPFVPNDSLLDTNDNRVAIITGPNMAGKSTYMRQTALIVLMAQIGSFVPAESATIGIVDSIFTRVGASDDLASGQSTFMVEMSEVAYILKNATSKSLIIFDEIGRGTSTFDGMSIARAVLEYVTAKIGAKTMFATHYHELTAIENEIDGVKNYNIAVKKRGDDITFLRRIVRGPADESYGIEVAKLAGIPENVVSRAKEILKIIDEGGMEQRNSKQISDRFEEDSGQMSFLPAGDSEVVRRLKGLDVNTLTPIESMQILYELAKLADGY
ncbi:MAG: DNA mismatch repair protein MutS [Oscillospiraceae bacterium]|nr:DNA mismatch repair protein MutS [Oscillospiraceae bacterium]MDD4412934.1 DNA mismatch repair protein MutS [Oscillospiraceae bacterium]